MLLFPMQSCRRLLSQSIRTYATHADNAVLPSANLARTRSTPGAVLRRREKRFGPLAADTADAAKSGLTPSDKIKYRRLKALGQLPTTPAKTPVTEEEFRTHIDRRRTRLRGIRLSRTPSERPGQGMTVTKTVVGQPVLLPNVIFRLVRNYTPEGQPYNPYEASFRVPLNITKTDIRSYLDAVYGLKVTYIRTTVHQTGSLWKHHSRKSDSYMASRQKGKQSNHKRVVAGLVEPFYYPLRTEDMPLEDREEREVWLEENYGFAELASRSDQERDEMIALAGLKKARPIRDNNDRDVPQTLEIRKLMKMKVRVDARKVDKEAKVSKSTAPAKSDTKDVAVAAPSEDP